MYDVLIIGGGAAGISCALVLGSAKQKPFATDKTIGIFTHQKTSHLQNALFNNVLGLDSGTTGASILEYGKTQLATQYPHIEQLEAEKVCEISQDSNGYRLISKKLIYSSKIVVIAVGYTNLITI